MPPGRDGLCFNFPGQIGRYKAWSGMEEGAARPWPHLVSPRCDFQTTQDTSGNTWVFKDWVPKEDTHAKSHILLKPVCDSPQKGVELGYILTLRRGKLIAWRHFFPGNKRGSASTGGYQFHQLDCFSFNGNSRLYRKSGFYHWMAAKYISTR